MQHVLQCLGHWIFTYNNTCQIVLIDFSGIVLLKTEIFEGFTKIEGLLPGPWRSSLIFLLVFQ